MVQFQSHFVGLYHKHFYSCNQLSRVEDNTVCYCQSLPPPSLTFEGKNETCLSHFRTQLLPVNITVKARVHW